MSNFKDKTKDVKIIHDSLYSKLIRFNEQINSNNWFIDGGLMLGIIRDNDFVSTDSDIDITLKADELINPNLFGNLFSEKIKEKRLEKLLKPFSMTTYTLPSINNEVESTFEINLSYPYNNNWRLCMGLFSNFFLQPSYVFDSIIKKEFRGNLYNFTGKYEDYLRYMYNDYENPRTSKYSFYKNIKNDNGFHKRINYEFDNNGELKIVFLDNKIKIEMDLLIKNFEEQLEQRLNYKIKELF